MTKEYDPTKPFNEQTRKTIEETWKNNKWNIDVEWLGKRAVVHERGVDSDDREPALPIIQATDGIGTKALLHWGMYKASSLLSASPRVPLDIAELMWRTGDARPALQKAAQDAVAMVFDDLIEQGAEPYLVQDHIIMQEEDERAIYDLTRGLTDQCIKHGAVITGGETAICDTIRSFEMGITATGKMTRKRNGRSISDSVLIGLRSSGIHSNGLTFARKVYGLTINQTDDELVKALSFQLPWGPTIGEELTIPTTVYSSGLLAATKKYPDAVLDMVHITGGGLTKLPELDPLVGFGDPSRCDFEVDGRAQEPHEIFKDMYRWSRETDKPLTDEDMYKKFNCGNGFVLAVNPDYSDQIIGALKAYEPKVIGTVRKGSGRIRIKSAFSDREVVYAG